MQKVEFEGFVGRDAEMRFTPNGKAMTSFSLGVDDSYKKGDEWVKRTMWVRVTLWGDKAELAANKVHKGMKLRASGKLNFDEKTGAPRLWKDKDGNARASFEMTAFDLAVDAEDVDQSVSDDESPF